MDDTTYDAAIVDSDGTVYRGNRPVPDAVEGATGRELDRAPGKTSNVMDSLAEVGGVLSP